MAHRRIGLIKYIDLFAGIGGIRLGFTAALAKQGIASKCVLSSEIDSRACYTYEVNFGECPSGDIRKIDDIPPFDMMLAGFPCQPFSYAGKKQGFGDTRGTLFFEIERILEKYKPKAFLLENVRGLKTNDGGRTYETIISSLEKIGYGTHALVLNSSDFGVPQNRVRLYILGIYGATPMMSLKSGFGAADSHKFKHNYMQPSLVELDRLVTGQNRSCYVRSSQLEPASKGTPWVKDILEQKVDEKYFCTDIFTQQLRDAIGDDFTKLHGYRLIDYRGGQSLHSWELGTKGKCTPQEITFMNKLIQNRRRHTFGTHQDGKKLTKGQIQTFYMDNDIDGVMASLISKSYLKEDNGRYNPVCGNMSFEIFKFLDPDSISITLTSSDANRLGVVQDNRPRRITPRECARLQGFPDDFAIHPEDGYAYKQFGNSVSVPVIEAVIEDFLCRNKII